MKRSHPSNDLVDVISSDDSSSSDEEMEVSTENDSKQLTSEGICTLDPCIAETSEFNIS